MHVFACRKADMHAVPKLSMLQSVVLLSVQNVDLKAACLLLLGHQA